MYVFKRITCPHCDGSGYVRSAQPATSKTDIGDDVVLEPTWTERKRPCAFCIGGLVFDIEEVEAK